MGKQNSKQEKVKNNFLKTDFNVKYYYNNTIYERKPNQFLSTDKATSFGKKNEFGSLSHNKTTEKDTVMTKHKPVKSSTQFSIDELPKISPTKQSYKNSSVINSVGKQDKPKKPPARDVNQSKSSMVVALKGLNKQNMVNSVNEVNNRELNRCNSNQDIPNINESETTDSKYGYFDNKKNTEKQELEDKQFFRGVVQDLSEFNLIKVIGRGTFGKVVLVTLKTDPTQIFALKIIKKQHIVQTKNVANIINEKKILQDLDNPYIVKLRYSFQNKEKIFMAFDYHNGGELFFHLQKRKRLPENDVKIYAAEIYVALKYLHSKGIIYRDLKPENIILDRNGHVKLIDFGLAKRLPRGVMFTKSFCGTNEYIRKSKI